MNTTSAGTAKPTKHTSWTRYTTRLAAMYSSSARPSVGGTGAENTNETGTNTLPTYTPAAMPPSRYRGCHERSGSSDAMERTYRHGQLLDRSGTWERSSGEASAARQ